MVDILGSSTTSTPVLNMPAFIKPFDEMLYHAGNLDALSKQYVVL